MTTSQDQSAPVTCPRCGGPMYQPAGSSLYWHANSNHPRCTITNIVALPKKAAPADDHTGPSGSGQTTGPAQKP
ncbi:MAG TPA: hypothetical protein VKX46_21700 [Ktedonobacteraceae bacterium]|nr:hypothetical protein [Ktedonobacteraceae bacterium]